MRETLIKFLDVIRNYERECGCSVCDDERDSEVFVDIFLSKDKSIN